MVFTRVWNGSQRLSARLVTTKHGIDSHPLYHDCVCKILQNQSKPFISPPLLQIGHWCISQTYSCVFSALTSSHGYESRFSYDSAGLPLCFFACVSRVSSVFYILILAISRVQHGIQKAEVRGRIMIV
ncbi:hypothetical protein EYC84_010220 [Monilinia fructicola]|uniref:Uncharacterized protein n=1 Tax=Monilinia fructicola TaxID=38448 RepID=A0A5M9JC21_MONFR|nr:hypothetical protein EYC84_010220 [Monilinia fructicola]